MKFFEETTKWSGNGVNHTYLLSDDKSKMFAFISTGTNSVFKFKKPIQISTKGRTFKPVANTFGYVITKEVLVNPSWEVKGSKGDVYTVEKTGNGLVCSCSGFKFRGKCRHTDAIDK